MSRVDDLNMSVDNIWNNKAGGSNKSQDVSMMLKDRADESHIILFEDVKSRAISSDIDEGEDHTKKPLSSFEIEDHHQLGSMNSFEDDDGVRSVRSASHWRSLMRISLYLVPIILISLVVECHEYDAVLEASRSLNFEK